MLHRSIMLHAEDRIHVLITRLRESAAPPERQALLDELTEIEASVHEVAHSVVDYQHVMDELDDNILVADKDEVVLYVNDAYIRHTGIAPEQILGKRITELLETGTYFTDPTVPEVIRSRKKVMKLSSMFGRPDSLGFVTGVPIFDDAGEIQYVVACNRGVSTFKELRDNFVHFVEAVNNLQGAAGHVQMVPNSSGIVTPQMVGESPAIQRVYDLIENVRQTTATVLITGESGVGKELIADAIYRTSSRAEKPFIKVNCASIPASLFESELFGYERGSFSGANASGKQGLFEAANNGTLLLDEIGEMPMDMQAKLLRAIQNNEITRVGGIRPIKLDIRYIASTNCDLKKKVREGTFRRDLYYRLNTLPVVIPPLTERGDDMFLLMDQFRRELNGDFRLTEPVQDFFRRHTWPGNIRELRNVVEYFIYTDHRDITMEDLPPTLLLSGDTLSRPASAPAAQQDAPAPSMSDSFRFVLAQLYAASEAGTPMGRDKLLQKARESHVPLSQQEVRTILTEMAGQGLARVSRGRGGSQLTPKGRELWEIGQR